MICAGILVFIGALDDRYDISVKIRATIQALVGIAMMVFSGLKLESLGHAFGPWDMHLGPFGYIVTLFAVWAAINAFNMVDGIDGFIRRSFLRFVWCAGYFTLPKWKLCTCVLVLLIYCRDFTLYHVKPWCLW